MSPWRKQHRPVTQYRPDEKAEKARESAERDLAAARARRADAEREAHKLRAYRQENDIAAKLWLAMGGRP